MADYVGSLVVSLQADIARFDADLKKATQVAQRALDPIVAMANQAKMALGAIGVGIGVDAFVSMARETVAAAGALKDLSEATGSSVESLSKLSNIARVSGVDTGTMEQAMYRLSAALGGTEEKSGKAGLALKALGIQAKDPADALTEVAKKLEGYADGANKAAIMVALFGKSGPQLTTMMHDIATNTEIAATVTGKFAKDADEMEKAFRRLSVSGQSLKVMLLSDLVPALERITSEFVRARQAGLNFFDAINLANIDPTKIDDVIDNVGKNLERAQRDLAAAKKAAAENPGLAGGWEKEAQRAQSQIDRLQKNLDQFKSMRDRLNAKKWDEQYPARNSPGYEKPEAPKLPTDAADALAKKLDDLQVKFENMMSAANASISPETVKGLEELDMLFDSGRWGQGEEAVLKYKAALDALLSSDSKITAEQHAIDAAMAEAVQVAGEAYQSYQQLAHGGEEVTKSMQKLDHLMASSRWKELGPEVQQAITNILKWGDANERAAAAEKARQAETAKYAQSLKESVSGMQEEADRLEEEVKMFGLSKQAILDNTIAKLAAKKATLEVAEGTAEEIKAIDLQIAALERQKNAVTQLGLLDNARQGWGKFWDDVMGMTSNFFDDLFNNGSSAFKNLWENFKRWALQALAQIAAKTIVVNIAGALGLTGGMSGQALAGTLAGGGNGLAGLLGMGGNSPLGGLTNLFGGGFNTANLTSQFLSSGIGSTLAGIGTPAINTAGWISMEGASSVLGAGGAAGLGTVGSAIAAAVPWLSVAAIAIPLIAGLFKKKPSEAQAQFSVSSGTSGFEDSSFVKSVFGNLGFADSATQYFSGEGGRAFSQTLADFFGSVSKTLSESQIANVSSKLQSSQFPQFKGTTTTEGFLEQYGGTIFKQVAAVIFDELNPALGKLLSEFDGTIEEVSKFAGSLAAFDALLKKIPSDVAAGLTTMAEASQTSIDGLVALAAAFVTIQDVMNGDPLADALELIEQQSGDTFAALGRMGDKISQLVEDYDESADAATNLATATQEYYKAQVVLLAQIETIKKSIGDMFGDTVRTLTMTTLSDQEKYTYLQDEAAALREQLLSETNPEAIKSFAERINSDIVEAFNLLDPQTQKEKLGEYTANISTLNGEVNARLTAIETDVQTSAAEILADIRDAIADAAKKHVDAADTQLAAADAQLAAAQTPIVVEVLPVYTEVNGG